MNDTQQTQAIAKCEPTALAKVVTEESPPFAVVTPREDKVRDLAHQKWEAAGCPEGDGVDFWLEAEQEVSEERTGSSSAQASR